MWFGGLPVVGQMLQEPPPPPPPPPLWWQSNRFGTTLTRLFKQAIEGRRNLTLAMLGGSSSAFEPNFGHYVAAHLTEELQKFNAHAHVANVNPSHGFTGSV